MSKVHHGGNAPSEFAGAAPGLARLLPRLALASAVGVGSAACDRSDEADATESDAAGEPSGYASPTPDTGTAEQEKEEVRELRVTATAYNTVPQQTHALHPTLTAFGDTLTPGMKAVAVSRDLEEMGIGHETELEIAGLDSVWVVRDRTHARWTRRIDLYMGKDVDAALEWGRREVTIRWRDEAGSSEAEVDP